jgi:hypothetical protein
MQWTKGKLALTTSLIIGVSVLALLGLPQLAGAVHVAPASVARTGPSAAHAWFPPMAAPSIAFGAAVGSHAPCASSTAHGYALSGGAASAHASGSGSAYGAPYRSMHHCGFMPRYNQLRA